MRNEDAPLSRQQLAERLKPRPALKRAEFALPYVEPPRSPEPGVRVFAPPVSGTLIERPDRAVRIEENEDLRRRRRVERDELDGAERRELDAAVERRLQQIAQTEKDGVPGYLPDHLALNPLQPEMDEKLEVRRFFAPLDEIPKGMSLVTTIFPPDQRRVFSDTRYPWCTTGRVDSGGGGFGSGTLVGPRHLLCASHMMVWNPDNSVNQVTFTPSYFDGNAPFGNSGIVHWYAYRKVVGPFITNDDIAEDYVVLVLEQRLGDICGWMGTRGYDSGWNGLAVWDHIGYPADLFGGARPTFQNDIPIDSTAGSGFDEDLFHRGDVFPGQSGGAYFAWFGSEPGPRACGVQSGQNTSTNSAGGGSFISSLVIRARADFP
jgi:V8-like Glu-specific endopeptidase